MMDLILGLWLVGITLWLIFRWGMGPQGPKGPKGDNSYFGHTDYQILMVDQLDDAEYMTKLIQKINSYQLHAGEKIE